MVNPITLNIPLYRNADYGETFYFTDDDGQPIDFTGYTGEFQLRRYENAPGGALASGSVDCTVGGGGIELVMPRELIDPLPSPPVRGGQAVFRFDVRLTTPGGDKEDWMRGEATAFGGVSR